MGWTWQDLRKLAVFGAILLGLATGGCATSDVTKTQYLVQNWQGKSVKELIAKKGNPDAISDDGKGGKVYAFSAYQPESAVEITKSHHSEAEAKSDGKQESPRRKGILGFGASNRDGSGLTYLIHERFYVNPDGNIYRVTYAEEPR
jgi:hypothetical protein